MSTWTPIGASERVELRCGAFRSNGRKCTKRVGAVHVSPWGPMLIVFGAPSAQERHFYGKPDVKRIPEAFGRKLLGPTNLVQPATPSCSPACSVHSDLRYSEAELLCAYEEAGDGRKRIIFLQTLDSAPHQE